MENGAVTSASKDPKQDEKQILIRFKAQHGLLVAFFSLIL
jgi:hypothetical protein